VLFSSQRTPLIYAAAGNHVDVCKVLIAAGADVNAKDDE
jgi:ankyrin repeat protein